MVLVGVSDVWDGVPGDDRTCLSARTPHEEEDGGVRQRWFSLTRTVFWIILTPIAWVEGWLKSVAFVSVLSIWALVESSYAAFRADSPTHGERDDV